NTFNKITNRTYPPSPPYFNGTYSNGKNWIAQLISKINSERYRKQQRVQLDNYAYGGATTDNNIVHGYTNGMRLVPSVIEQIQMYKNQSETDDSQQVFVIWAGANDFLENNSLSYQTIVASLINCVKLLLSYNAKRILVFNEPPAQYSPQFRLTGSAQQQYIANFVNAGNQLLSNEITKLKNVNNCVVIADVYLVTNDMIMNPAKYGFENNTTNCLDHAWDTGIAEVCIRLDLALVQVLSIIPDVSGREDFFVVAR
ncbi:unnamed protein product, partial [Didymodactylos carnosus]